MVTAAGDRPLIEMGSRRTHEWAAVASARAAYIAGFASTSNLRARFDYGVPSAGTSAHAFTLVHDSERHAFETQVASLGTGDDPAGGHLRRAPRGADRGRGGGPGPRRGADRQRRPAGAGPAGARGTGRAGRGRKPGSCSPATWTSTRSRRSARSRWTATGSAPRWSPDPVRPPRPWSTSWWRGLLVRTGSGELVPVAKRSVGKPGRGGRKWAVRHRDAEGIALSERISLSPPDPGPRDRELLVPLVVAGEIVGREDVTAARDRHRAALAELPAVRAAAVPRLPGHPHRLRARRHRGVGVIGFAGRVRPG